MTQSHFKADSLIQSFPSYRKVKEPMERDMVNPDYRKNEMLISGEGEQEEKISNKKKQTVSLRKQSSNQSESRQSTGCRSATHG